MGALAAASKRRDEDGMTIDDLYEALGELKKAMVFGFDNVDKRFDGTDGRLDGIDARLEGIDARLGRLETRSVRLETRVEAVEDQLRDM
jgi:archaellum component FlaC